MEQTLGKRIMYHRKRLSLTQDQLAEQLGVTAQAVSKWENDQSCPDISTIPRLAAIFGISTDALLGYTPAEEQVDVHTAEVVDRGDDSKHSMEFHYDNSRRTGLAFGLLVLLVGSILLCSEIFCLTVSFWSILWPSALLVYGVFGLYPRFRYFRLVCMLLGIYMLLNNLSLLPITQLPGNLIFPIVLLIVGVYLLLDAQKKPNKPEFSFVYNGNKKLKKHFSIDGEYLQFEESFSENHQLIEMPMMSGGRISTGFGDYTLDLSGVEQIGMNCTLELTCHFGELCILVPKHYQVHKDVHAAFADCSLIGAPDMESKGDIWITGNVNFGEICIKYI